MSTTMMIQIPAGTAPNAVLQVRAPDGRTIKVRVPRNMRPGQQMRISVPAAAAPKATKPAAVPANQSRGRLPVAGLVGRSFGLYQKDQKAWLALDETKRLVKIDVGHRFSRKSAKKLCEERGGRLAYRREIVDEKTLGATPKLRVNGGKAFGGNKCAPVSLSTRRRDRWSMYTQVDPGARRQRVERGHRGHWLGADRRSEAAGKESPGGTPERLRLGRPGPPHGPQGTMDLVCQGGRKARAD
jgi:hypothetical protein